MSGSKKILILLFISLFMSRLWILLNSYYTFYSDDAIYAMLARSWIEGKWQSIFHPTWPPLYPGISALLALVIPGLENALRFTSLVFGTAIIIPLFFLLRHTLSDVQAISFSVAIALFTSLLTMSLLPLSDSLAGFLIISGLVSVFFTFSLNDKYRLKLLVLGSGCFGLLYLTRTEGTMFFFLTLLYLLFHMLRIRTKKYFLTILLFVTVFIITISPYVIASRVQIGEWSLSPKFSAQIQQGHTFALNQAGTTWAQEVTSVKSPNYKSPYFKNGTDFLLERLYYFMHLYPEKQSKWQAVFLSVFPLWVIPLILVGMVSLLNKRYKWGAAYLIFIIVTAIPITVFSTPVQDIRYLAWTIPIFLYFFYLGVSKFVKKGWIAAILSLFLVLIFPGTSVGNIMNPNKVAVNLTNVFDKRELKSAGVWIKNNSIGLSPRIMMRHEGVEFYADGVTIYLPQVSYNEMVRYARKNKVDYIVAWEEELAADEKLSGLLDDKILHPGLIEVYKTKGRGSLIVYTLKGN